MYARSYRRESNFYSIPAHGTLLTSACGCLTGIGIGEAVHFVYVNPPSLTNVCCCSQMKSSPQSSPWSPKLTPIIPEWNGNAKQEKN